MSVTSVIGGVVKTMIGPVADAYIKSQERKQAKESAKSKLQQAKQKDKTQITLTDAEGEAVLADQMRDTWKDEYVTISVVSLFNLIVIGGIETSIRGEDAVVLQGTVASIQALQAIGVDVGTLLTAVVFAAIGLKFWRR